MSLHVSIEAPNVIKDCKWFQLRVHYKLSNHEDGIIQMWQDGVKILDTTGQTLPTADSIYYAMQVGITATPLETVLYVDDVVVGDRFEE